MRAGIKRRLGRSLALSNSADNREPPRIDLERVASRLGGTTRGQARRSLLMSARPAQNSADTRQTANEAPAARNRAMLIG